MRTTYKAEVLDRDRDTLVHKYHDSLTDAKAWLETWLDTLPEDGFLEVHKILEADPFEKPNRQTIEWQFNVNVVACWEFNNGEWEQTQNQQKSHTEV